MRFYSVKFQSNATKCSSLVPFYNLKRITNYEFLVYDAIFYFILFVLYWSTENKTMKIYSKKKKWKINKKYIEYWCQQFSFAGLFATLKKIVIFYFANNRTVSIIVILMFSDLLSPFDFLIHWLRQFKKLFIKQAKETVNHLITFQIWWQQDTQVGGNI